MKITELLKRGGLTVSFEVFPPKNDTAFDNVREATESIASLRPSFVSVTYGAGGGTSKYTLDIARNIKEKYSVPTVAHLTCVSSTKQTVKKKIAEIQEAGIENVMALRGDIPKDRGSFVGDYRYAYELIEELRALGEDFCIGAACYPERHPESSSIREDIIRLREKVDTGADFLTTQMFFDNALFYSFMYRIREAGINVPVLPGIMPITNAKQVARARELSGSFMPQRFMSLIDKFGSSAEAMMSAGVAYATDQIIDLFANGIRHIHLYTMNSPEVAKRILSNLSGIIG